MSIVPSLFFSVFLFFSFLFICSSFLFFPSLSFPSHLIHSPTPPFTTPLSAGSSLVLAFGLLYRPPAPPSMGSLASSSPQLRAPSPRVLAHIAVRPPGLLYATSSSISPVGHGEGPGRSSLHCSQARWLAMKATRVDRCRATSSSTVVRPPVSKYAAEATADRHPGQA